MIEMHETPYSTYWSEDGLYHRLDGPAIVYKNGSKMWYLKGDLHRIDGPACEYYFGGKSYYVNGVEYTEAEFNEKFRLIREHTLTELYTIVGYRFKIIPE